MSNIENKLKRVFTKVEKLRNEYYKHVVGEYTIQSRIKK